MVTEQNNEPAEVMQDREDTPAMEAGYSPVDAALAQGFDPDDIAAAMFDYGPAPTSDMDVRLAALEFHMRRLMEGSSIFPAMTGLAGLLEEDRMNEGADYLPEDTDLPSPHDLVAEFRDLQRRFNIMARGLGYDHLIEE